MKFQVTNILNNGNLGAQLIMNMFFISIKILLR